MADQRGRDFAELFISVFRAPADAAALADYREAGIQEAVLEIPDRGRDEILKIIDGYAPLLK